MKPLVLSDEEAEALQRFFRYLWIGHDDSRKPLHGLIAKVDLYLAARDLEPKKVAR